MGNKFTGSQKTVILGSLGAAAIGWGLFFLLRALLPAPGGPSMAMVWLLLAPAVVIFVLVAAVGNARFLGEGIDPLQGKDPRFVTVTNRALGNTVEQTLIFVLVGTALVQLLPVEKLVAIPALAVMFAAARVVFWLGYLAQPVLRAPGMSLTLQINVVLLIWCALRIAG